MCVCVCVCLCLLACAYLSVWKEKLDINPILLEYIEMKRHTVFRR